jgi:hypothetical protein
MLTGFALSLLFSIALCVHVVRTQQPIYWLAIILMLQPLGGLVYLIAIVVPGLSSGATARRIKHSAEAALDPTREYREAKAALGEVATVHNRMRLARAAAALGRHEEAQALFGEAAQGIHAEDPALLLGRAQSLIELNRPREALPLLETLGQAGEAAHMPQAILARARAYEALGRDAEAEADYHWAAGQLPGLEGLGRQAAFLARQGRLQEARTILADMDRRLERANPQFRGEGRIWRQLAAQAIGG